MFHPEPPAAALDGATTGAFDQPGGQVEAELTANPERDRRTRREEVWRLLQSTIHYCQCAQMHLEADDDTVGLYDMRAAREYFVRAIRTFEPLRRSIAARIDAQGTIA